MEKSKPIDERPTPLVLKLTRPFWEAASRQSLVMQKCDDCGEFIWYPRAWCVNCGSQSYTWTSLTGKGTVYSFTIIRQVVNNSNFFEGQIPFAVGVIELEEGPRMISSIVGCEIDEVRIGMPVRVMFEDIGKGIALPKFRPEHENLGPRM